MVSGDPNEAAASYDPTAERFLFGGRKWPNTDEAWVNHLDAIHDPTFWPSMAEADAAEAHNAWHAAREAWRETRGSSGI